MSAEWRTTLARDGDLLASRLDLPAFDFRGRSPTAELLIDAAGETPEDEQAAAVEFVRVHQAEMARRFLAAVADWAGGAGRSQYLDHLAAGTPYRAMIEREMPAGLTPEGAAERVADVGVFVSAESAEGVAYIEVLAECSWDSEHGVSVVFHRDGVKSVGQQGHG